MRGAAGAASRRFSTVPVARKNSKHRRSSKLYESQSLPITPIDYEENPINHSNLNEELGRRKSRRASGVDSLQNLNVADGIFSGYSLIRSCAQQIWLDRSEIKAKVMERVHQKKMIKQLFMFVIFMGVYFTTLLQQFHVSDAFLLEKTMTNYLVNLGTGASNIRNVNSFENFWTYLETGLVGGLFPAQEWYNGAPFNADERGFLLNYNKLVAGFSLIQQRVDTNATCAHSKRFSSFLPTCWPALSTETMTSIPFGPEYSPAQFKADPETGNFRIGFPLDADLSGRMIQELKKDRWLDKNTRTIRVEFSIFNSAKQLFVLVRINFKHQETGLLTHKYDFTTFSLEPYLQRQPIGEWLYIIIGAYYLTQFAWGVFSTMDTHQGDGFKTDLRQIVKKLADFWTLVEFCRIFLFFSICTMWWSLVYHEENVSLSLPVLPQQEVSLGRYADSFAVYQATNAIFILLCLMRLMYFLSGFPKAGVIVHCIAAGTESLVVWALVACICFTFFGVMAMMMFGSQIYEFSTFYQSFMECIKMALFDQGLDLVDLSAVNETQALLFYGTFMFISILLLLNIFLAILMDSYAAVNAMRSSDQDEYQEKRDVLGRHLRYLLNFIIRILNLCLEKLKNSTSHEEDTELHKMAVDVGTILLAGSGEGARRKVMQQWDVDDDDKLSKEEIVMGIEQMRATVEQLQNDLPSMCHDKGVLAEIFLEYCIQLCSFMSWKSWEKKLSACFMGTNMSVEFLEELREGTENDDNEDNDDVTVPLSWDEVLTLQGYERATMLAMRYGQIREKETDEEDNETEREQQQEQQVQEQQVQDQLEKGDLKDTSEPGFQETNCGDDVIHAAEALFQTHQQQTPTKVKTPVGASAANHWDTIRTAVRDHDYNDTSLQKDVGTLKKQVAVLETQNRLLLKKMDLMLMMRK